jgi:DNA-binding NarL/FixJ family response regulator
MDRARTRAGRADPLHALELWHGLLAGRWSLVDHVDRDGRRLVLARRNEPEGRGDHPALTSRQRQVLFYASVGWSLKQLAYALGLAEGTITHHLRVALRKVGMSSRAELVRVTTEIAVDAMMRGLAPPEPATAPEREPLTAAERAIVDGVIATWSNARIAEARGVSLHTVANQLTSIYRKLGLRGRHELVRWASSRKRR